MLEPLKRLEQFRRFDPSHPEGFICHDGDCDIWRCHICTCGLIHTLLRVPNPDEHYKKFSEEWSKEESTIEKLIMGKRVEANKGFA